ncbi:hypothetical protein [Haloarcula sediminis]|uniref:hypothetical protein n=1 Tax=Haloarcula sediminis TaxID=3111777 RepID=UPI002D795725|nr:hypothetical protein [Haloarcula sp. CK38]
MDGQTMAESLSDQELAQRVVEVENRLDCLETTLASVADEIDGLSLSSPCGKCEKSLLLIKDGTLYCPYCGNGDPL